MGRVFVVNASPLILLARIKRLDLLSALADEIVVPVQVMNELDAGASHDDAARSLRELAAAKVVDDTEVPQRIQAWDLGPGESQVLAHAFARAGAEAILDDRAARRCARVLRIPYTGTLGIVLTCRRANIIPTARPVIEALVAQGLRLAPELVAESLAEVGE
ncbi:MAG TPA: DUF3368 domain-containing protein [Thermoanaerobaculia bacterium]|nr:DUF3368 domain-containing protein [Thermoanaerobaculia bacterium]